MIDQDTIHHRLHKFYGENRDIWMPLKDMLKAMKINENDVVADIGAGDGYYTFILAKYCKRVYALDVDDYSINIINKRIIEEKNENIITKKTDVCKGWILADVTYAFFSNSFHDLDCRNRLLEEIYIAMPATGRIALVEFKIDTPFGPPNSIRLSPDMLDNIARASGFTPQGKLDFKYHYFSIYKKGV